MGRSKSPTDELVDGIDAIGSILDENLPEINSQLASLSQKSFTAEEDLTRLKNSIRSSEELNSETRKAMNNLDIRVEEVLQTIAAMTRRIDLLHKAVLELSSDSLGPGMETADNRSDGELADTVKILEDRLKLVEKGLVDPQKFTKRF